VATKNGITVDELEAFIQKATTVLLAIREKRERPVTDTKSITSWNALQISALCEAYEAFGNEVYRKDAIQLMHRILSEAVSGENILQHVVYSKGKKMNGYLEDYAFTISALIDLYEITFDEKWLMQAKAFTDYSLTHYHDDGDGLFWFTSDLDEKLIARKKEISDNVIASSNSEMANALYRLSILFEEKKYADLSARMLKAAESNISRYPSSYSNWLSLMMNFTHPTEEIVITGDRADQERKEIAAYYFPRTIFCGGSNPSSALPLLENRFLQGKTLIYVCRNKTCKLPVESSRMALSALLEK
jgi:uncharacterized protein YyaL (SSP411 family)